MLGITDLPKRNVSREISGAGGHAPGGAADDFVCVVGPSGCGKSHCCGWLRVCRAHGGKVSYVDWPAPPRRAMSFKSRVFPWLSVLDNWLLVWSRRNRAKRTPR